MSQGDNAMSYIRLRSYIVLTVLFTVLCACATNRQLFSPIKGSMFGDKPIRAERIYVICNFPFEYRKDLAKPLANKLKTTFVNQEVHAVAEIQNLNPLALDSGINFHRARLFKPDVILLVRMGESTFDTRGISAWTVNFDLLDSKGKGIWRGWASFYRRNPSDETVEQFANEMLRTLVKAGAITLPGGSQT